jgi:hypothetical protein
MLRGKKGGAGKKRRISGRRGARGGRGRQEVGQEV